MASGLLKTSPSWAMLPIRIALGTIMFAHGAQKVFGVWGGPGLSRWIELAPPFPEMRPPWLWMGALALSQFFGGAMVMIGLYTRIGAFLIASVSTVAIFGEQWKSGFLGGFEYSFALLGMALALLIFGGGAASIDSQMQIGK